MEQGNALQNQAIALVRVVFQLRAGRLGINNDRSQLTHDKKRWRLLIRVHSRQECPVLKPLLQVILTKVRKAVT